MNEFERGECDGNGCRASLPFLQWCTKCHAKEIEEENADLVIEDLEYTPGLKKENDL